MIREATEEDILPIVEMGEAFQGQTVYGQCATFDAFSFRDLCLGLIRDQDGCLFVTDDLSGMSAALWCPCMFNAEVRVASELWLYTTRYGAGKPLLRALEDWARAQGCVSLSLTSQLNMKDVSKWYERLGYGPVEKIFVKVL